MTNKQINSRLAKLKGKEPMSEEWQNLLCDVQEELENVLGQISELEMKWELTNKQEEKKEALEDRQTELERVWNDLDDGKMPQEL